ncbi:aminotransferase class I/II-fold pyridoxal phosphate-dependent enzyme [Actinospica sp.]|uniref:aminotransferase class I/II-fold pyridoxal phosphate-dependent enzyme n=1 Tax=Actinospica sp. TaxID=1872142 RepID=UPI002C33F6F4|nr:aminotransferase class I/II-fold pyridoxal phosphate-dependent enzyme [Actinospica sp.]HWG22849.1 aminotransferase class I/II-fold pyridoxal phosphate-dependent enzyme [Actinospica sp.]
MSEQSLWWERYKLAGAGASEIASSVEAALTAGLLSPGESLPPVRDLAERLGVNPNTVASAYRALRDRGTVETRGRAGTRVRDRPGRSERNRSYAMPEGVRDLTSGEPDPALLPQLAPPTHIDVSHYRYGASTESALEEQLRRRLARNFDVRAAKAHSFHGATDRTDATSATVAELVTQAKLVPVFGALDGVDRLLATHTRPGDKVAIEDPAWGNLLDLVAARGITAQPMRIDDEGPDPVDLRAALAAGVRAVIVTTRAQNPYGAVVSPRRAAMLRAELAAYPDVLTIDDDHGADLTPGAPQVLCGATHQWAYLYSASKAYGPDLRIAVLVGDEDSADRVAGQLRHTSRRVSGVMQNLWAAALADAKHDAVLAKAAQTYAANREALIGELARRGVTAHGETGLNVWIPVPDETAAATGLLARGWAVAPGSWFRVRSGPGIRVTIAGLRPGEAPELAEAVAGALRRGGAGRSSASDTVQV